MARRRNVRPRVDMGGLRVVITRIEGEEDAHAHEIEGRILYRGAELGFRGVAFGRIGGFNVSIELDEGSRTALREMGLDGAQIEALETHVQRMIVEGRFESHPDAVIHRHRFD